jgi:sulfur carrier protein ThiS
MLIKVVLHSYLREKLPADAKGRAEINLPEGSTVADLFTHLDLPTQVAWAINGNIQRDIQIKLKTNDEVRVFRQGAGG